VFYFAMDDADGFQVDIWQFHIHFQTMKMYWS
jgi:hypothetical protein